MHLDGADGLALVVPVRGQHHDGLHQRHSGRYRGEILRLSVPSAACATGIPTNEKAPNASNTAAVKAVLLLTV